MVARTESAHSEELPEIFIEASSYLRLLQHKKTPKHGTPLYQSHLWASDLGRVEMVKDVQRAEVH
jgi:hypothetical protein